MFISEQFGVVVFNDEAKTLDGCYENQLVPATSTTKKKYKDFLSSQSGDGGADFGAALRKAFMYFKANSSVEGNGRGSCISACLKLSIYFDLYVEGSIKNTKTKWFYTITFLEVKTYRLIMH